MATVKEVVTLLEGDAYKLASATAHMAAIQIVDQEDGIGFNNADKFLGAHLSSIISLNPTNQEALKAASFLIGVKYRKQTVEIVGPEDLDRFARFSKDKPTKDQRDDLRSIIAIKVTERGVVFSSPYSEEVSSILRSLGGRHSKVASGHQYEVLNKKAQAAAERLVASGFKLAGESALADISFEKDPGFEVTCKVEGDWASLWSPNDSQIKEAIRSCNRRMWVPEDRCWKVKTYDLPGLAYRLDKINGLSFDSVRVAAESAPLKGVSCISMKGYAYLNWDFDPRLNPVVKGLPGAKFRMDWPPLKKAECEDIKGWRIEISDLTIAIDRLSRFDLDLSHLQTAAAEYALSIKEDPIVVDPKLLEALYGFQKEGVEFLTRPIAELRKKGGGPLVRGAILADEMGLGKTIQSIVASNAIVGESSDRILVVCPKSAMINWNREIKQFAGVEQDVGFFDNVDPKTKWVLINYDMIEKSYDKVAAMRIGVLLIDEAQNIRNEKSLRCAALTGGSIWSEPDDQGRARKREVGGISEFVTRRVFPISGTPMPNRANNLIPLLRAIGHRYGSADVWSFKKTFCDPVTSPYGTSFDGSSNMSQLAEELKPYMIQRFKSDVTNIPPKIRSVNDFEIADMSGYHALEERYANLADLSFEESRKQRFALLNEMRQWTAKETIPYGVERAEEIVSSGQKILIFTEYHKVIEAYQEQFGDKAVILHGKMSPADRQSSIDRFQNDPEVRVFIGQRHAAGVAITLTAASFVLMNDLDWVPANHSQNEDRAHRIGTTGTVNVEYMRPIGTFAEKMWKHVEEKLKNISAFQGRTESILGKVDRDMYQKYSKHEVTLDESLDVDLDIDSFSGVSNEPQEIIAPSSLVTTLKSTTSSVMAPIVKLIENEIVETVIESIPKVPAPHPLTLVPSIGPSMERVEVSRNQKRSARPIVQQGFNF